MPSFEVWDILKVPFPYTDRPVRQRRPARPISPVQRSMLIAIRSLPGSALVDDPARPVLFLTEQTENIGAEMVPLYAAHIEEGMSINRASLQAPCGGRAWAYISRLCDNIN